MRYVDDVVTRWGLHSIIRIDGEAYAVQCEWTLYRSTTGNTNGGVGLQSMPTGKVRLQPLADVVTEESKERIVHGV